MLLPIEKASQSNLVDLICAVVQRLPRNTFGERAFPVELLAALLISSDHKIYGRTLIRWSSYTLRRQREDDGIDPEPKPQRGRGL